MGRFGRFFAAAAATAWDTTSSESEDEEIHLPSMLPPERITPGGRAFDKFLKACEVSRASGIDGDWMACLRELRFATKEYKSKSGRDRPFVACAFERFLHDVRSLLYATPGANDRTARRQLAADQAKALIVLARELRDTGSEELSDIIRSYYAKISPQYDTAILKDLEQLRQRQQSVSSTDKGKARSHDSSVPCTSLDEHLESNTKICGRNLLRNPHIQAIDRCEATLIRGSNILRLNGLGLKDWPTHMCQPSVLIRMVRDMYAEMLKPAKLSADQLKEIEWPMVTAVDLSENDIRSIPLNGFFLCPRIEYIDLRFNHELQELPVHFMGLRSLQRFAFPQRSEPKHRRGRRRISTEAFVAEHRRLVTSWRRPMPSLLSLCLGSLMSLQLGKCKNGTQEPIDIDLDELTKNMIPAFCCDVCQNFYPAGKSGRYVIYSPVSVRTSHIVAAEDGQYEPPRTQIWIEVQACSVPCVINHIDMRCGCDMCYWRVLGTFDENDTYSTGIMRWMVPDSGNYVAEL
eukprot:Clim_evm24s88 gene=Clim_evmTU24s88